MMQLMNDAFAVLREFSGNIQHDSEGDYSESFNHALNAIMDCVGLAIEICGGVDLGGG